MDKRILDYIVNLEDKNVRKKHGKIVIDGNKVKDLHERVETPSSCSVYKFLIDDTPVFAKAFSVDSPLAMGISRMFHECGIATPITSPLISESGENCFIVSQDLNEIGKDMGFDTMELAKWRAIKNKIFKMRILENSNCQISKFPFIPKHLKEIALDYMTPEAIEEINSILLLQELATYTDGHQNNYIAFINPETFKLEYLVPIDLEFFEMLLHLEVKNYNTEFKDFLKNPYTSITIFNQFDGEQTYPQRIKVIRHLIQNGQIDSTQIEVLKKALQYNLGKEIKDLGKHYGEQKLFKAGSELVQYLWEYNRNTIGRDLGM